MSTTWVFIGLLAGREIGMRLNLEGKLTKKNYEDGLCRSWKGLLWFDRKCCLGIYHKILAG